MKPTSSAPCAIRRAVARFLHVGLVDVVRREVARDAGEQIDVALADGLGERRVSPTRHRIRSCRSTPGGADYAPRGNCPTSSRALREETAGTENTHGRVRQQGRRRHRRQPRHRQGDRARHSRARARRPCSPPRRRRTSTRPRPRSAITGRSRTRSSGDLKGLDVCEALHKFVKDKAGRCDVLVNNAGATRSGNFLELPDEAFHDGFALKYYACVRLCTPVLADAERARGARRQHHRRRGAHARCAVPDRRLGQFRDGEFLQRA